MVPVIRIFFAFMLLASLAGCTVMYRMRGELVQKIDADPYVEIILRFTNDLFHEKRLTLQDSKVYYNDNVTGIRLDFITQDIIELPEARELLVYVTEGLLEKLNGTPDAAEQSKEGHFTYHNLEIYIQYESFYVKYDDPLMIGWVTLREGMASFYAGDVNTYRLDVYHCRTEPYYKTRQYVRILKDAEENYQETHPQKRKKGEDFAPTGWFSTGRSLSPGQGPNVPLTPRYPIQPRTPLKRPSTTSKGLPPTSSQISNSGSSSMGGY